VNDSSSMPVPMRHRCPYCPWLRRSMSPAGPVTAEVLTVARTESGLVAFSRFDALDHDGWLQGARPPASSAAPWIAVVYQRHRSTVQSDRPNLMGRSTHLLYQSMEIAVGGCMMSISGIREIRGDHSRSPLDNRYREWVNASRR
jgi:hypothetical protein